MIPVKILSTVSTARAQMFSLLVLVGVCSVVLPHVGAAYSSSPSFPFSSSPPMVGWADTSCPDVVTKNEDRRGDKSVLRVVQYNAEWLFVDYDTTSKCPGTGCAWENSTVAEEHFQKVAAVIKDVKPDIINICEVEGCDELHKLKDIVGSEYKPYLIRGADTSTNQNVGILTKVDPAVNLFRTEERYSYPIAGSQCGYTGVEKTSGVSKHYITEFKIGSDLNIAMIGAHLVAIPTDYLRCAQREAQASVLADVVANYTRNNFEVILLGDLNDYDGDVLDFNNNVPTSVALRILKGRAGGHAGAYELMNLAEVLPKAERYTRYT